MKYTQIILLLIQFCLLNLSFAEDRSTVGNGGDFREIVFASIGDVIVKTVHEKTILIESEAAVLGNVVQRYTPRIVEEEREKTKFEFYFLKKDWQATENDPYRRIVFVAKTYLWVANIADPSDQNAKKIAMWAIRLNKNIKQITNPIDGEKDGAIRINQAGVRYCAPFPTTKNTVAICTAEYDRIQFSGNVIVKISQHPKTKKFWGYLYKRHAPYATQGCKIEAVKNGFQLSHVKRLKNEIQFQDTLTDFEQLDLTIELPKNIKTKSTRATGGTSALCDAGDYDGCWDSMGFDCQLIKPGSLR